MNSNDVSNDMNRWQKRKLRTRQLLMQTTYDLLLEKGYSDLTIQDITDRADLARGTFYVHFSDKDELIWVLFEGSLEKIKGNVFSQHSEYSYHKRKYFIWKRVFDYADEQRDLLRVMLGEKGHPAFSQQISDYFSSVILQAIQSGAFTPQRDTDVPYEFMAQFMAGALVRLMLWSLDQDYNSTELARMFYEIIFREPLPSSIVDKL